MNAAQTPQSNDCRMASFTWNFAPSIDPAVPEAVFLKHAASALPAKPAHITAAATAAAQINLIICKLLDIAQYPRPEIAADGRRCPWQRRPGRKKSGGSWPRGDAARRSTTKLRSGQDACRLTALGPL